jgi:hypothetical protein
MTVQFWQQSIASNREISMAQVYYTPAAEPVPASRSDKARRAIAAAVGGSEVEK